MGVWRQERGAVTIIEATFVFPIVFFIVFFMIMAGEAYYQYAQVEYEITSSAIRGAAKCENPMLQEVISSGSVPTDPTATDVMPYRYIFTGEAKRIAGDIESDLENRIRSYKPLLFRGMSPQNVDVTVEANMNILVSSLVVNCTFEIPFPIRMIFSGDSMKFNYSMQMAAPVGDPSEFVRNVAMVGDIIEQNKMASELAEKATECMKKIGVYIN